MKGKKLGIVLAVLTVAMVAMTSAVSGASATEIKPANTKITATLQPETQARLITKNAYSKTYFSCKKVEATFTTPPSTEQPGGMKQNQNKTSVGTYSQGPGSVAAQIEGKPKFEECSVREFEGEVHNQLPNKQLTSMSISTNEGWTITGWGLSSSEAMVTIGVPSSGEKGATSSISFSFNIGLGNCIVTVGPVGTLPFQTVLMGTFNNASHKATIDGQVKYIVNSELACAGLGAASPAQFEAVLNMNNNLEIIP